MWAEKTTVEQHGFSVEMVAKLGGKLADSGKDKGKGKLSSNIFADVVASWDEVERSLSQSDLDWSFLDIDHYDEAKHLRTMVRKSSSASGDGRAPLELEDAQQCDPGNIAGRPIKDERASLEASLTQTPVCYSNFFTLKLMAKEIPQQNLSGRDQEDWQ